MRRTKILGKNPLSSTDKIEFIRAQIIQNPSKPDDFPMPELPIPPTMSFGAIILLIITVSFFCLGGYTCFKTYQLKNHIASLEEIHQTTLETHKELENLSENLNMPMPTPLSAPGYSSRISSFFFDVYNYFFGI